MENTCRFCFETNNLLKIGCLCKDSNYTHLHCADQWFSDRMEITMSGKLKSPTFKVTYTAICEICNGAIGFALCRAIYGLYDKHLIVKK